MFDSERPGDFSATLVYDKGEAHVLLDPYLGVWDGAYDDVVSVDESKKYPKCDGKRTYVGCLLRMGLKFLGTSKRLDQCFVEDLSRIRSKILGC